MTEPRDSTLQENSAAPVVAPPRHRRWPVRIVGLLASLLLVWHVFASFLWIFPPSPLRQLVSGQALSSYMLPLFGQSWSVFAPEPINGNYHLNVRAILATDAGEETTGWVSATDVELSMIQNNLLPPRAGVQAEELASLYKNAWEVLEPTQQEVVAGGYYRGEWESRLKTALRSDENGDAVDTYMGLEHTITAYATQVARAIWGDDVVYVQFRVSRQNVIPYADRNDPEAERPEPSIVSTGWRAPVVNAHQNEAAFADVFRGQYEKIAGN